MFDVIEANAIIAKNCQNNLWTHSLCTFATKVIEKIQRTCYFIVTHWTS